MAVAFFLILTTAQSAFAHRVGLSIVYLRVTDDAITGRVDMWPVDLQRVLDLGLPEDRQVEHGEVAGVADQIRAYLDQHLAFSSEQGQHPVIWTTIGPEEGETSGFFSFYFELGNVSGQPTLIDVTYDGILHEFDDHTGVLVVEHHWGTGTFANESGHAAVFLPDEPTQRLDLSDSSWWTGVWGITVLGMHHIWIGIDHILFLLALLLPSVMYWKDDEWAPLEAFRPALINVIKIVTLFTVAHTITLSLASLNIINLPSRLVESIIAASIALAALHNIFPKYLGKEWMIVFGFGLFHGFGFASVLGDLNMGTDQLIPTLLGFNIGVEIGQVVVVFIVFPILFAIRKATFYRKFIHFGSWLLVAISMYWFVERAFDIPLTRYLRAIYRRTTALFGLIGP